MIQTTAAPIKLTEHQIDVVRAIRKKVGAAQSFTAMDIWPQVKRADYTCDRLVAAGVLARADDGERERRWVFTTQGTSISE